MINFNVDWLSGELVEQEGLFPKRALYNLHRDLIFCAPTAQYSVRFWVLPGGSAAEKSFVKLLLDVQSYKKGVCFTRRLNSKLTTLVARNGNINVVNGDTGEYLGHISDDDTAGLPEQIHLDITTVLNNKVLHDWQLKSRDGLWQVPIYLKNVDSLLDIVLDRGKCPEYIKLKEGFVNLVQLLSLSSKFNYWKHEGKLQCIEVPLLASV